MFSWVVICKSYKSHNAKHDMTASIIFSWKRGRAETTKVERIQGRAISALISLQRSQRLRRTNSNPACLC